MTHLAPELLEAGSKITTAVDTWAFGILMYEAYCGGSSPCDGLSRWGALAACWDACADPGTAGMPRGAGTCNVQWPWRIGCTRLIPCHVCAVIQGGDHLPPAREAGAPQLPAGHAQGLCPARGHLLRA